MATYKVPYQNLEFNIPDTGQVFRYPNDPYAVYVREGNTIKAYSLMALGGGQKAGEHASVSESKGREILKSKYGLDFESLPTFSGADAQTALGGATAGDWGAFNPTTPTSTGEVITKSISPINPQGADITSSLTGAISKSPSIQENLARAGATPEQQAQIAAGTQIGQPTQISPELKAQITPEAKPITTPATSQWQTPEQRTAVEKATGAPIPTTPTYAPGTPTALIGQTDQQANADMQKDLVAINAQTPTGTTDYNKMFASVVSLLSEQKPPTAPSMVETFQQQRAALGVGTLEGDLSGIDAQMAKLDADWQATEAEEGGRLVSMAQIRKRQSALGIEYTKQRGQLEIERSAIARQISNKLDSLNMYMNLTQQDFTNASNQYNSEFSRNIQIINLFSKEQDKYKADAQANYNTVINMMTSSGKTFTDLDADMQKYIYSLELQQGLPVGTTKAFVMAKPNTKILSSVSGYDSQGNQQVTYIYEDPKTGLPGTVQIVKTGGVQEPSVQEKETQTINETEKRLKASAGTDGFIDPQVYLTERRNSTLGPDEFDKRFKDLLSPQEKVNLGIEKSVSSKFLTRDWFKSAFTEDQLKASAKEAGMAGIFKGKETEINEYMDYLMTVVEQYRKAGYSDEEILKLMK
jgi:hypothetical protein